MSSRLFVNFGCYSSHLVPKAYDGKIFVSSTICFLVYSKAAVAATIGKYFDILLETIWPIPIKIRHLHLWNSGTLKYLLWSFTCKRAQH